MNEVQNQKIKILNIPKVTYLLCVMIPFISYYGVLIKYFVEEMNTNILYYNDYTLT